MQPLEARETWPKVSIVIAACNEVDTIENAIQTMLQQTYPNFEMIVVNDRSTDQTGRIIDQLAAADQRILPIHIQQLPAGWLGKVHALYQATLRASGEWLLYTDADVHFLPDILSRVIDIAEREQLDHLGLIPRFSSRSFVAQLAIATALRGICLSQRPWHIDNPDRPEAMGAGAFNLVRKNIYDKTPGFEWLRMEVADDIGLAQLIKQYEGKTRVFVAANHVEVEWYTSVRQLVLGLEKNAFAQIANFSLIRGVSISLLVLWISLSPVLLLLPVHALTVWPLALLAFVAASIYAILMQKAFHLSWYKIALSFLVGDLFMCWVMVRSTILGARRGGVIWRGTTYPSADLRKGRRVVF